MAGAYAALVSVMTVMDNLKLHPYPPISLHPKQAESLTQHLSFLEEFLEIYDQNLPYSSEADPLENRIADAAHAAEDAIKSHVADRILSDREGLDAAYSVEDEAAIESHIESRAMEKATMQLMWLKMASKASGGSGGCAAGEDLFCHSPNASLYEPTEEAHAAQEAEDAIKSHIADCILSDGEANNGSLYEAIENVIHEMDLIQKKAIAIKQTMAVGVQHQRMPFYSLRSSSVAEKSSMVGVDAVFLQLKDELVAYQGDLRIIPIVGMGGTGKTTLAINIYQDPLIKEHFHIRAWATISQEYNIREILVEVLSGLRIEVDKHSSEDALGEMLYKHLFGRKYLIVMDDMWSIQAWDGIRRFLPNNKNGSRIVITTRLSNLASDLPNSNSLEMKLLDETNSWNLLSKTVFGEEGCPLELEDIGKEIGKSCKGLPLSIVVVGGFLAKSKRTREYWKYIEENMSIIVNLEDYERCLEILHMSYKQLPIYLKPCFLYMRVFPEDKVIRISHLVKLWVAEGFLKPVSGGGALEDIARVYIKDLADRNLILIHNVSVTGKIKSCKIHDLLRDLCLREGEKERFRTLTSQGIVNGKRCIFMDFTRGKKKDINTLSPMSQVRSLIWNVEDEGQPSPTLRLLWIFNSRIHRFTSNRKIVESVHQFVNSRFLQFQTDLRVFRLSIWRFWNLQSLIVDGMESINAPSHIWYMPQIRHLMFGCGINLPDPPKDQEGIVLRNLQTLVKATNFKCSEQVVKRIPNIKRLKTNYEEGNLVEGCLTNLNHLDKLESLTCDFDDYDGMNSRGTVAPWSQINFPHSLKKLHLHISQSEYWEQDLLEKIGSLPFLQKLQLHMGRFKDGKWETTEGQFRSLKSLYLDRCKDLQVWTTESSHFPCLSYLSLTWKSELEEIPLEFAEVSTLREIYMSCCSDSAVVSAKRILEEYEELHGEADLQVHVTLFTYINRVAPGSMIGPNFYVETLEYRG